MTASDGSCDFRYVHSDIPEGMTIREWRARRAANRPTRHRWRRRTRTSAVMVWRAATRALAQTMFARVRARENWHRAPRRTAPPSGEITA
jgi:hypothetical protein